jgi:DNA-binding IclR family transcriptional regulator
MNKQASTYSGTQAVERAVTVLKAFGPEAAALTPHEISRRTRLNRSTVYRLLSALERQGLVAPDEAGRYRLGPELVVLGGLALRQLDLRSIALPLMRELAAQTGETVDLEVLAGASTMIVEEVSAHRFLSASANVGQLYPAHCTATGKALLAHLPPAALDALLGEGLRACGPRAIRDEAALRAELRALAARGYAAAYEELEAHLHALAAPVFDHQGRAVAAISVSGPAARLPRRREQQVGRMVMAACAEVSRRLGYRQHKEER